MRRTTPEYSAGCLRQPVRTRRRAGAHLSGRRDPERQPRRHCAGGRGGAVVEFLSYEGNFTAVGGPADGMTSTDIAHRETATALMGQSLQRDGRRMERADGQHFGACNDEDGPPPSRRSSSVPAAATIVVGRTQRFTATALEAANQHHRRRDVHLVDAEQPPSPPSAPAVSYRCHAVGDAHHPATAPNGIAGHRGNCMFRTRPAGHNRTDAFQRATLRQRRYGHRRERSRSKGRPAPT